MDFSQLWPISLARFLALYKVTRPFVYRNRHGFVSVSGSVLMQSWAHGVAEAKSRTMTSQWWSLQRKCPRSLVCHGSLGAAACASRGGNHEIISPELWRYWRITIEVKSTVLGPTIFIESLRLPLSVLPLSMFAWWILNVKVLKSKWYLGDKDLDDKVMGPLLFCNSAAQNGGNVSTIFCEKYLGKIWIEDLSGASVDWEEE